MEKRILNDLETIYYKINDNCKKYDYNCRQCSYDKLCDKVEDVIKSIGDLYNENK